MTQSLKEFKDSYLELLINFLWRQWSALGISGYADSKDNWFIDPEALLMFTCSIGRYDARLFDEVLDWLNINGSFINIQRLRNVIREEKFTGERILGAISEVISKRHKLLKWKGMLLNSDEIPEEENLFFFKDGKSIGNYGEIDNDFKKYGFIRGRIELRGHTQPVRIIQNTGSLIKLRALFGLNARCEIILYLLSHESAHPSLIAKEIYYTQKTVQDILVEMSKSGLIQVRPIGKEKHYRLDKVKWFDFLKIHNEPLQWIKWPAILKAIEEIWLKVIDKKLLDYDLLLLSSELRILMQKVRPKIETAGFAETLSDEKLYLGEDYTEVFLTDIKKLLG